MTHEGLLDWLRAKQTALGESDSAFARRLTISRQQWQFLRTNKTTVGQRSAQGIVQAFPELTLELSALFLRPEGQSVVQSGQHVSSEVA